ncbi:MAG: patatin-like phospholipase family protein [Chloroflexi bacterium]|nr:MAG: patatin-like phospholipase family protein [Chloroflexota bacterium]
MARAALVLGGGGITGAAWEIGMIAGLHAAGVDLTRADAVIGTSAGAIVGAQILSGVPIDELYSKQFRDPIGEVATHVPISTLGRFLIWTLMPGDERQVRARIGRAALRAHTMPESERKRVISSRLPVKLWPNRDLLITAIDAESGEFVVFKRDSGVDLVDAVAASCAVPLVYPPATVGARRFIDGGMRSSANADLAKGFDPIVALTPVGVALRRSRTAEGQIESLGKGIRSLVVKADAHARKAMGTQFLDPALRASSARAGWTQATSVARAVAEVWASARA